MSTDEHLVASAVHCTGWGVPVNTAFAARKAGHGNDDWVYVFSCPLYSNHRYRKGLVTDVSGPQRNACPGTLNGKERGRPLRAALIIRRRLRLSTATLSHEPTVKASRTSRLRPL